MGPTVQARIRNATGGLTASERKIANAVLADYPFTALDGIQELAARTGVSAPSITRFVAKIGCAGFGDFQRQLIAELKESRQSPVELQTRRTPLGGSEFLADYARRLSGVLGEMADTLSQSQFETVCALVADPSRNVFLLGGRVSDTIAAYLSIHLRQLRAGIFHIPADPELWPEHVLRMRKRDVVILFDLRRYQKSLQELAEIVRARRHSTIVLVTDKWMSPVARSASHVVALPIEAGTAWDSSAALLAFVEALIVRVSEADWNAAQDRIRAWDAVRLDGPPPPEDHTP
ncbi:MAG: RpiR family transcriptional regulator [Mesorhizobium amorphae]|nr:MAG: RpiR family transcriptional regulator [Mesorhizobium amorphae]